MVQKVCEHHKWIEITYTDSSFKTYVTTQCAACAVQKNIITGNIPPPIEAVKEDEDKRVMPNCNQCGDTKVVIRGKYPKGDAREICPTCTYEILEQINDMSSPNYNQTYKSE